MSYVIAQRVVSALLLSIVLLAAGDVRADLIAYTTPDTTGNQAFTGNLGMDFNVNSPILVTALGAFDSGQLDFAQPIAVGLYARDPGGNPDTDSAGTLIESTTITGDQGTVVGNFRFVTLPSVLLQPGSYSIVAVGFNSSNSNLNGNENNGGFSVTTDSGGGLISFVGTGRFDMNSTLDYPSLSSADQGYPNLSTHPFGAGSFEFTDARDVAAVPAPTNFTLVGIGILCLLGRAAYRRRLSVA